MEINPKQVSEVLTGQTDRTLLSECARTAMSATRPMRLRAISTRRLKDLKASLVIYIRS